MNYLASGVNPQRLGNAHPNIVPYQAFQTSDGYIILAIGNDTQFERFCELAGRRELAADERFRKNSQRVKFRAELVPQVAAVMREKTSSDWLAALNARGIPCGPINDIAAVFDDPQVRSRGLQLELAHPLAGKVASVANPIRLSESAIDHERAPPQLGQDTAEVLQRVLQLDEAEIAGLRSKQAIA